MELVHWPSKTLSEKADEIVDVYDVGLRSLITKMVSIMQTNGGIGLSANQVGLKKRIIVIQIPDLMVMINPLIIKKSARKIKLNEKCLSFQDTTRVIRPENIFVRYFDDWGNLKSGRFDGLAARVIQHEIDHLDGITLADFGAKK